MIERFVEPQVFHVGYTVADMEGIRKYLEASGNLDFLLTLEEAKAKGIEEGEALISMMAKLCYKSLSIGQNTNITRVRDIEGNIAGILGQAHGSVLEHVSMNFIVANCSRVFCFAEDTELLTFGGWKGVAAITTKDRLITKNPQTGECTWNHPLKVHSFKYSGDMVGWETSQGCSPRVTSNHLLWAASYDLRRFRGVPCSEIIKSASKIVAEEVYGKRIVVDNSISKQVPDHEVLHFDERAYDAYDLFRWLGWMATDGGFSKDRPNQCTITQSKMVHWRELEELLSSLFGDRWRSHGPYQTENGETSRLFIISASNLAEWARAVLGPNKLERDLSPLLVYHSRLLRGFLDSAIKGDGSTHKEDGHEVIYCPSRKAAGHYQAMISMVGQCATVHEDDRTGESHEIRGVTITNRRPCYVISISRKSASLISKDHWDTWKVEDETVYCPETKHGLVFARREGCLPIWSGNTHELVRHRVGSAFSQTSGRYCALDLGTLQVAWDPILEGCETIAKQMIEVVEIGVYLMQCEKGLREPPEEFPDAKPTDCLYTSSVPGIGSYAICGLDSAKVRMWVTKTKGVNFDRKKKLTSAFRRFAPNGQTNEIGVTFNIRTLRHTILMRTARYAEWEIRKVYEQIYFIVKKKFPLLFADAKEEIVDGIVEVTGMKMAPYDRELKDYTPEELQAELDRRPDAADVEPLEAAASGTIGEIVRHETRGDC